MGASAGAPAGYRLLGNFGADLSHRDGASSGVQHVATDLLTIGSSGAAHGIGQHSDGRCDQQVVHKQVAANLLRHQFLRTGRR